MFGSLLAALILAVQPAPAEAAVEVESEVQVEVEPDAPAATSAAEVEAEADTGAEAAAPAEDVVCRRRLRPSNGIGRRYTVVRECRPRTEAEAALRRR